MDVFDLVALAKFKSKYPTWWYTIGVCDLSRDFTCAPQAHSPEMKRKDATVGSVWDKGFMCDCEGGSIADAINDVMTQIEKAMNP